MERMEVPSFRSKIVVILFQLTAYNPQRVNRPNGKSAATANPLMSQEDLFEGQCVFCEILQGKGENSIVFEDGRCVAFLDHRPLFPGHCLVVPRDHVGTLEELPKSLLEPIFAAVQLLARAMKPALDAEGTFVGINNRVSQSVPHFHVHVVPRHKGDGLRGFFWPRQKYKSPEDMEKVRNALRSAIVQIQNRKPS
jgi:histidine triad (HIT) family protein